MEPSPRGKQGTRSARLSVVNGRASGIEDRRGPPDELVAVPRSRRRRRAPSRQRAGALAALRTRRPTAGASCSSAATERCTRPRTRRWRGCQSSRSSRAAAPTTSPARSASPPTAPAPWRWPRTGWALAARRAARADARCPSLYAGRGRFRGLPRRRPLALRRRELRRPRAGPARARGTRRCAGSRPIPCAGKARRRADRRAGHAAQLFLSNLSVLRLRLPGRAPGADPADGWLEAIVFQARRRAALLRLLAAAYRGHHIGLRRRQPYDRPPGGGDHPTTPGRRCRPARHDHRDGHRGARTAPDRRGPGWRTEVRREPPLRPPSCSSSRVSLAAVGAGVARALTTTYVPGAARADRRRRGADRHRDDRQRHRGIRGAARRRTLVGSAPAPALPFMVAGVALAAGGLVAIGLGTGTSYLALGLAAALAYTGLNAADNRAPRARRRGHRRRAPPGARSAPEIAGLVGAGGRGDRGALIEPAPLSPSSSAAGVLPLGAAADAGPGQARRLGLGNQSRRRRRRARAAGLRPGCSSAGGARGTRRPDPLGLVMPRCRRSSSSTRARGSIWSWAPPALCRSPSARSPHVGMRAGGPRPGGAGARPRWWPARRCSGPACSRRSRHEPRSGGARVRGRGRRARNRDDARLRLLRALRARGPGRPLQRRVLRRARGRLRCRAAVGGNRGGADRHLPGGAVARRARLGGLVPLMAAQRRLAERARPARQPLRPAPRPCGA